MLRFQTGNKQYPMTHTLCLSCIGASVYAIGRYSKVKAAAFSGTWSPEFHQEGSLISSRLYIKSIIDILLAEGFHLQRCV